jgi:hypothetical protein
MLLHPGQHFVDLANLPATHRAGSFQQQAVRLVEHQEGMGIPRFRKGGGDVLLGAADERIEQIREAKDEEAVERAGIAQTLHAMFGDEEFTATELNERLVDSAFRDFGAADEDAGVSELRRFCTARLGNYILD